MSGDSLRRVLRRCVEDYGYSWDTTRQIINRMLGGHYTVESLQALYRKDKEPYVHKRDDPAHSD